jgi:hypothetical protein
MSSQSEPPPLNVGAVRRAREIVESGTYNPTTDDGAEVKQALRDLLETYENLAARHAMLAAQVAEWRDQQARRASEPAHPNTMIEGGGRSG